MPPSLGFGSLLHRRRRHPNTGDNPLGTDGGLTNTQYRQDNPDPSITPYDPNSYSNEDNWPVNMIPPASSPSSPSSPVTSATSGLASIGAGASSAPASVPNNNPNLPSMVPGVTGPNSTAPAPPTNPNFTAMLGNSGLYTDSEGNTTHAANENEQNQYGYWGKDAYENAGSGGGGLPGVGFEGIGSDFGGGGGIYNPYGLSGPPVTAVGRHGVK